MKKLIVGLLVVVALLLLLPFATGILAKQELDNRYVHLNQIMARSFHLELEDYHRGWFCSTAKVKVHLESAKISTALDKHFSALLSTEYQSSSAEKFPLVVDLVIFHGPIIFSANNPGTPRIQWGLASVESSLDLPWNERGKEWVRTVAGRKKLVTSASLIHYSGDFTNVISVPAIQYTDTQNNWQLSWEGVKMSSTMSRDSKNINFNLIIAPVHLSDLKGVALFDSSDVNFDGDTKQSAHGFWFGDINISMNNFVLSENAKPVVSVVGVKALQQSAVENDKISTSLKYQVDKIDVRGQSYGPSSLALQINKLGGKEFKSISDTVNGVDFDSMPEEQLAFLSIQIVPELVHMVNGSSLDLAFITKAPAGDVNLTMNLKTAQQDSGIVDPLALAKSAQGQCVFSVPKSLLKTLLANEAEIAINAEIANTAKERGELPDFSQTEQLAGNVAEEHLAALQQEGWISASGDSYQGKYEYKDGTIISNGKLMVDVLQKFKIAQPSVDSLLTH